MNDYGYVSIWTVLFIKIGKGLGRLFVFLFKLSIEGYKSTYHIIRNAYNKRKQH